MAVMPPMERSRKRNRPSIGDVFAFPLADGTWALGHIVRERRIAICCVLFAYLAPSVEVLRASLDDAMREPIGILITMGFDVREGAWPIVGHRTPSYPDIGLPAMGETDCITTHGPVALSHFVEAFHGLRPWDEGKLGAKYNRAILLPHLPIPAAARFHGTSRAPGAPPPSKPPPVTDGPALVTIQLVYPGAGMPSTDLVRRRQDFERRLEAAGVGDVEGAETGGGVMEVYLRARDVRRAVPLVEKLAEETGWKDDMLIETAPLDDDDDDGDDDDV